MSFGVGGWMRTDSSGTEVPAPLGRGAIGATTVTIVGSEPPFGVGTGQVPVQYQ